MELITKGKNFYPDMKIDICILKDDDINEALKSNEHLKLIVFEEGTCVIKINNDLRTIISPAIMCINHLEEINIEKKQNLKVTTFCFKPNVINSSFNVNNIDNSKQNELNGTDINDLFWLYPFTWRDDKYFGYMSVGFSSIKKIKMIEEKLIRELSGQTDMFWPCRGRSFFLELLFYVQHHYSNKEEVEDIANIALQDPDVVDVVTYLNANYDKKLTITDVTKNFGTNKTTLTNKFNKAVGMTVMNYLNNIRIQLAKLMLRDTQIPISEVIERVGFVDPTHFGRTFKKQCGLSPSDYRREYNWMLR